MGSSSMEEPSDVDVDDELLGLAFDDDDAAPQRKRSASSSLKARTAKRRKQELTADSDEDEADAPESEEDDSNLNPYPLEGKYKDEADRQRLLMMEEFEREVVLAQRLEEKQRLLDKQNVTAFLKVHRKQTESPEVDNVSSAAKRKHTTVGKTQEKAKGLAALAEKRRVKKERDANKDDSTSATPRKRRQHSSDDDYSSEDGEVNKLDAQLEAERNAEEITLEDLGKARITRDMLAKYCLAPWFEDFVKGGWVRYHTGLDDKGMSCYRLCEIVDVGKDLVPPYALDTHRTDRQLELRHAELQKCWNMDRVSNGPFPQDEFDSLVRHLKKANVKLPKKKDLERKQQAILRFSKQTMTDADVQSMVSARERMNNKPAFTMLMAQKARLKQRSMLATKQRDDVELAAATKELAELEAKYPEISSSSRESHDHRAGEEEKQRHAANAALESRKHAAAEEARRRKARANAGDSRPGTPPVRDLSARVKTVSKLTDVGSRSATPKPADVAPVTSANTAVPSAPNGNGPSNLSALANSIDFDLGDF